MLVPPHRSLVQILILHITLPFILCSPQVDLELEQSLRDNQRSIGDFYLSNIDTDKYPTPDPISKSIAGFIQQSDIINFLQWIHPPEPPKCDNGLFAFCCSWPAPNLSIGIRRPPNVDPEEIKKRRRKCREWNRDRLGCLVPENNFCCDCKDVNDIAYNCYNPFYRDDPRFQGKPEPKPSPLGSPAELDRPTPFQFDLKNRKELDRDPQNGNSQEDDKIERRAVVAAATNQIKTTTSKPSSGGEIGGTGADTQLLRAWKRAQVADDGDDPDRTGADVEILRAWKRALPKAADDGDDPDETGVDVENMRAWKRAQREVSDGDETKRAGADAQLLRAWKRSQPVFANSDDISKAKAEEEAQHLIMRVRKRAQHRVSASADAKLFAAAWKRSQGWESENSKGSGAGEDKGMMIGGQEHYDVGNPRDNDPTKCKKKYLEDLGVFS